MQNFTFFGLFPSHTFHTCQLFYSRIQEMLALSLGTTIVHPVTPPKTGRNTHFGGWELHKPRPFCGPIPGELASMIHLLHIDRMCHKCLIDAGPTFRELGSPHPRFSSLPWLQRTERWPCILSFFCSLLWEFRVICLLH